jgi:Uma2 family endonuclease
MNVERLRYTVADLRALESLPENQDKRFELLNGEIYEVGRPSPLHTEVIGTIYFWFRSFLVEHPELGKAFVDGCSYILPNGDELAPDVSFVARARLPDPLPGQFTFAPDLAVEVFSPSNREREMYDKAESYLKCGTRVVWIVYPVEQVVDVLHLTAEGDLLARKVARGGALDGEDVLPGFSLPLAQIFGA